MATGVGFGLAIFATVDICIQRGQQLIRLCNSVKHADAEIRERIVMIDGYWTRTNVQLDFLRQIWSELNEALQATEEQVLHVLISKLSVAISKVESCLGTKKSQIPVAITPSLRQNDVRRFKYALFKESLDNAIRDMKAWQELFDLSWLLTMRISSSQIDMQLMNYNGHTASQMLKTTQSLRKVLQGTAGPAEGIFKPKLEDARIEEIPFSTAKVARRSGSSKLTVLDPAPYIVQGELDQLMTNVRNLARKLKYGDPLQFGLMEGDGVIREQNPSDPSQIMFTFVFKPISGHSQPRSLRASLLSNETDHSLSDRVQIANDLAKAVIFVHTFGFVHKNICPENILLSTDDPLSLGHSYLVGFGAFRNAEGHTWRRGDDAWERNLYRHQQRQGPFPDEHYIMQHDIYSLGVCLLEVGLWESFVLYDESGKCGPSPAFSESLAACGRASNKDCFVLLARKVLPRRMGTKYARIVETCLTCLDNGNTDFGDESEFQDVDGVLVGVRYIEKVLLELSKVSI